MKHEKQQWFRTEQRSYLISHIEEIRARRARPHPGCRDVCVAFRVDGEWHDEATMYLGELIDLVVARSPEVMKWIESATRRHRDELIIAAVNDGQEAIRKAEKWWRAMRGPLEAKQSKELEDLMKKLERECAPVGELEEERGA